MRSCLIADDHALVRDALAATVAARWPGAALIMAGDFPTAWAAAAAHAPDLCLADLDMPGAAPIEGVEALRAAAPRMKILVVTGSFDDAMMLDLLARGVHGFAPKSLSADVIGAAIALVLAGGRYLPQRLADMRLPDRPLAPAPPPRLLTERQREVARLMARGQTNKDIARSLGIVPATIKTHVAQVIALTGASNRTEAAMRATELGLL